jgi:hypothetical protein
VNRSSSQSGMPPVVSRDDARSIRRISTALMLVVIGVGFGADLLGVGQLSVLSSGVAILWVALGLILANLAWIPWLVSRRGVHRSGVTGSERAGRPPIRETLFGLACGLVTTGVIYWGDSGGGISGPGWLPSGIVWVVIVVIAYRWTQRRRKA